MSSLIMNLKRRVGRFVEYIGDNMICENKDTNLGRTLINIALRCDESYYCLATEAHQLKKRLF